MAKTLRFGGFVFEVETGELRNGAGVSRLEPQPSALLALLASRQGELVSRDDIRRHIWGDQTHVNVAENIAYCVRAIRVALHDDARAPQYVETIPRRGVRFVAPVASAIRPWPRAYLVAASLLLTFMLGGTVWFVEQRPNRHHEMVVGALRAAHALVY